MDEKELGNRAFGAKEFSQAIVHFSKCIELDPECAPLPVLKLVRSVPGGDAVNEAFSRARHVLCC